MQTTYTEAPPPASSDETPEGVMSWLDHAKELRDRLIKVCFAIFVGILIGFWAATWRDYALVNALVLNFEPAGVQTLGPAESFANIVKLAVGIGVAIGMPVIVYQLLAFIVPGLTRKERRVIFLILPFVTLCFISGLVFGWFVTLPAAFNFFKSFGPPSVENKPSLELFLSLFTRLMLVNGALFELPVLVYSVIWLGVIQRTTLTRYRRYSILVIVILSSIITPTGDPVNLSFTAIPMYLLYELGLLLALIAPRRKTPTPIVD